MDNEFKMIRGFLYKINMIIWSNITISSMAHISFGLLIFIVSLSLRIRHKEKHEET
jgi:hypothetical protein